MEFLVPIQDSLAMAVAIETALKKPNRKEDLMTKARQFDVDVIGEQYYRAFVSLN